MDFFHYCILLCLLLNSCVELKKESRNSAVTSARTESGYFPADSLLVLTYNICWSCMTDQGLSKQVVDASTTCSGSLAAYVNSLPATLGFTNYDFVATQESSGIGQVVTGAQKTLGKMKMVYTRYSTDETKCEMATFYNNKYILADSACGELSPGRPVHILIFQDSIIFINIHNCHSGCNMAFVEQGLSGLLAQKKYTGKRLQELATYRIIVAGDFNFGYAGAMVIIPFGKSGTIKTVCNLNRPPVSCCLPNSKSCDDLAIPWNGGHANRPSDLIFDSYSIACPAIPPRYDTYTRMSDHLPVIAILPGY